MTVPDTVDDRDEPSAETPSTHQPSTEENE